MCHWAGVMSKLQEILDENGYEATIVGCEENASTQISQIENFITSGCDMIMVHPHDADAVEESCKQALDAGIKVMCWDNEMENTTANWFLTTQSLVKRSEKQQLASSMSIIQLTTKLKYVSSVNRIHRFC